MRRMIPKSTSRPLLANHSGPTIGRIVRYYEHDRKWYCDVELDDSLEAYSSRRRILSGEVAFASLHHSPATLEIEELLLCERPRRQGAEVTTLVSASVDADGVDGPKDDVYNNNVGVIVSDPIHFIDITDEGVHTPDLTNMNTSNAHMSNEV